MSAGSPQPESVAAAAAALAQGEMAVLLDDDGVGHLLADARNVSGEQVVAMLDAGGAIFSVALTASKCAALRLPDQVQAQGRRRSRVAVSVDAREGITTGISAAERALTARVVAAPETGPDDVVVPGHVPPLIAEDAGVLAHRGAAEAAVELIRRAGGSEVAAICAILGEDGTTASAERVRAYAAERGTPLVTITDLLVGRLGDRQLLRVERRERAVTQHGTFAAVTLIDTITGERHSALVHGDLKGRERVALALAHSSPVPVEDLLAGLVPGGESDLARTLKRIVRDSGGVLVYLGAELAGTPRAYDVAAATVLELGAASVLPLDPELAVAMRERGIPVQAPRSAPRSASEPDRGAAAGRFEYEIDMTI